MISRQKTVNYARALFNIKGTSEEIHQRQENLEALAEIIKSFPEMVYLLGCPQLTVEAKLAVIEKALQKPLDPHVKKLLTLVLQKRKVAQIRPIAAEYHKLVILGLKEMDVEVATAEPLTAAARQYLKTKLEEILQKKVNLIETINPGLLGGFTVLAHNQMLDLSIKGKLINLKKQLLKAKL